MNLINRLILILVIGTITASPYYSLGQINTVPGVTALQLAQALVGPGATVLNPVITGASGAYGTFSNGSSTNIGIDHGIILTSGTATLPNTNTMQSFGVNNGLPGDPLLAFAGTTLDATRFEFDVIAYDSILTFNYVFASDEYNDFVNSINDAFGFFISGPGIIGQQNIAVVPGTSTQISINNVNCGLNGGYYVCNDPYTPNGGGCTTQCPASATQTNVEYDGFTTLLTAQANVMSCDTYHLVLVIADVSDGIYDSGVMIANLLAGTVVYQTVSNPIPNYPTNVIVEGCTTGEIQVKKISNSGPCGIIDTTNNCQIDTLCYQIVTSGNAIEGIDYQNLPDTVCISFLDSIFYLNIIPIADGNFEPPYDTIIVDLYPILDSLDTANCSGAASLVALHAMFLLMDPFVQASPDDTICNGGSVNLSAISNLLVYSWSPPANLSCTNCPNPVASPTITTQYTVTASFGSCNLTDDVLITVDNIQGVNAGTGGSMCPGGSVFLNASGASGYLWTPATGLSDPNSAGTQASPAVSTTYTVTANSPCGVSSDTAIVTVHPVPTANAWPDSSVCPNESVQLHASGGISYAWTGYFLSDDSVQNPLATPTTSTVVYTVTVANEDGCTDTAQVTLHLYEFPEANAGTDISMYLFDSTQLNGSGPAGSVYSWTPPNDLSNPNSPNPFANPTLTTVYILTVTSADGCVDMDTMIVVVTNEPLVKVPNAFSPNGDGHNDFLKVIRLGVFNLTYLKIYNRWGEIVFESHNISDWWNGKYKGEDCEVGVYTYVLEGEGYGNIQIERKGNITLVR